MKRNIKGFTMVELLAAIVILGILIGISIPAITSVFDNSRKKVYVSDARKLIALAENKVKTNNSEIEKPDDGNYILISLLYLDTTDLDSPPGGGEYVNDKSYVVVKNDKGKLEYAACLVEKLKKGGYKGIDLATKSELVSRTAAKKVDYLTDDDVFAIDSGGVTSGYINEKLGRAYLPNNIEPTAIYHYTSSLVDNSSNYITTDGPRIVMASILSTSDKYYNTLDAVLQLRVDVKDGNRSDLKVYISLDDYDDTVTPEPYGDATLFKHNFDFSQETDITKYEGDVIKIYVIVKDPKGNETRKTLTYKLHMNVAPVIDKKSAVTSRDRDVYHGVQLNMLTAKVKLLVSDDIDDISNLQVCLKESSTKEEFSKCDDYRPYKKNDTNNGYFNSENVMEYLFHNCNGQDGKCRRDGSTHYLTIFVKDSYGLVTKRRFAYTFSENKIPEIQTVSVESNGPACKIGECPVENGGSKQILVRVIATDDVDDDKDMSVGIGDGIGYAVYGYVGNDERPIEYSINGNYDGTVRTISIRVIDSEEGISEIANKEYLLYKNKPPEIKSFSISSHGAACLNSANCPIEEGGNKEVNVHLNVEDDIDYQDLQVCLSIEKDRCYSYASYPSYATNTKTYTMPHDHDGSTQTVYVYVNDSEGLFDSDKFENYKLYVNQNPVLEHAIFYSKPGVKPLSGSLRTIVDISASDDVDKSENIRFNVIQDGVVILENARIGDYVGTNREIKLAGKHDGKTRNLEVVIIDSDHGTDSTQTEYAVYEGKDPTIDVFNVYSDELPCLDDKYCPIEEHGHYNAKYIVRASDDIDNNEEMQICVSESSETCDNYVPYSDYLEDDLPKEMDYIFNADSTTPYDGTTRQLYLYLKDSDGNIVIDSKTYKLYANKKPVITEAAKITKNVNDTELNYPDITYTIDAEDDLDTNLQIAYCHKKDGEDEDCTSYMDFQKSKVLNNDNFFKVLYPNGESFVIYSKIKDSYGEVTKSNELTYEIYTDMTPSIYQSNIISGTRIYKNNKGDVLDSLEGVENPSGYSEYTRMKIKFTVDDPYDEYSVCVSANSGNCSNYKELYSGNNCITSSCDVTRKYHYITYDNPGFIESGKDYELYLFVRDTYGHRSSATLYNDVYNECEFYNEEDATYEYEFDSEATHSAYNHTNPITMVRCSGKCYYRNSADLTTNEVFAKYKTKITYTDKFNSSVTCNADNPKEIISEEDCDFKECFYKNDSYVRRAIGTRLYVDEDPWMVVENEHIYTCTGHYDLYLSSYNGGDKDITLTKTNTRICNTALDNGEYDYDSTAADPYVRISD